VNSRISDIHAKIKSKLETQIQASGAINPTKFESDIVAALNKEQDIKAFQSGRAKTVAEMCADTMRKKFGAITKAKQVSKSLSVGSGASVLTPIYKKFMCVEGMRCNGDPKCDISMSSQMHGKMQVSMKKQGDAQIATAQYGEANAVISASIGKDKAAVSTIRDILSRTLNKKSYYELRSSYETNTGKNFDTVLATMTGLKTGSSLPSVVEMKEFNEFLNTIGIKEKITLSLREFMTSTRIRKAIFKEFASGEKRFIDSESYRKANWFMMWSENGNVEVEEIDSFVDSHYGSFRMNIRDRGSESGGSLRIDIREQLEAFRQLEKELTEEFDKFCLVEGVLDTTLDLMRSAGSAVVSVYKKFISVIKNCLSFIAALFVSGFSNVLEFFGLETTELSYSW